VIAAPVFWLAIALVFYAYAGYPLLLRALAPIVGRPVRRAPVTPAVTFIITAYNEEARLGAKIENTLSLDYPPSRLEILVASDCSTDRTDAIACASGDRVRLVRASVRGGKEAAQRLALDAAHGEILVFSDVATALASDAVSRIVTNFADPTVGCVSSIDRFVDEGGRPSGESAYVRYEMWLRALETRVHSLVGLSGSFFAARRAVCRRWASDRQSDFTTLLHTVQLGMRGVLDPTAAGYYRDLADAGEFARKTRTVVRGLAVLARHLPMLNPVEHGLFAWELASHKLCRWLVPFAMLSAAFANAALVGRSPFYAASMVLQVMLYAAAIVGLRTEAPALRLPAFLVQSNAAVLVAWWRFACGDRMTSWTPSRRLASLPSPNPR